MIRILIHYTATVKIRSMNSDTVVIFFKPEQPAVSIRWVFLIPQNLTKYPLFALLYHQICFLLQYIAHFIALLPVSTMCHQSRNDVALFSDEFPVYSTMLGPHNMPDQYSKMLLLLCNYIKAMVSFPIRILVNTITAHIVHFYREITSPPRPWSKFKSMKDKGSKMERACVTRM